MEKCTVIKLIEGQGVTVGGTYIPNVFGYALEEVTPNTAILTLKIKLDNGTSFESRTTWQDD